MPGFNRTGPAGNGPMTGRRAGYCTGNELSDRPSGGIGLGRAYGQRMGRGAGFGRRARNINIGFSGLRRGRFANTQNLDPNPFPYARSMTPLQEVVALKQQKEYFENALNDIQSKLQEVEPAAEK